MTRKIRTTNAKVRLPQNDEQVFGAEGARPGRHEAPRVHHVSRRRGGGVAEEALRWVTLYVCFPDLAHVEASRFSRG